VHFAAQRILQAKRATYAGVQRIVYKQNVPQMQPARSTSFNYDHPHAEGALPQRRMREKSIARAEIGSESRSAAQAALPSNNRPCGARISVQDYVRFRPRVEMSMQTCIYVKSRLCEGGIFSVDLVVSRPLFAGGSSLIIFEKPQHPRDSGWAHKSSEIKLICFPIVLCFERASQNRELHSSRDPALIISSWVSAERFGAELEPRWQTLNEL
jgi:hypothetical protein